MGHSTSSGRSAGADANVREGRQETAARSLSNEQIREMSANIDRQGYTRVNQNEWELIPRDSEINTAGVRIRKVEGGYSVETWGTTNQQVDQGSLVHQFRSLADAKAAGKEELKGWLPGVRYNPRTGARPGPGRGLVTSSRATTLAGNRRPR